MNRAKKNVTSSQRGVSQEELTEDYPGSCVAVTFMRKIPPSSDANPTEVAAYLHEERIISKYATVPPAVQYNGGVLSALNIRLTPTVHSVPLGHMRPPPYAIEPDEVFVKLYKDFILGRASAYHTRLDEKDILAGYYRGDAAAAPIVQNTPDQIVDQRCMQIRSGRRPTIFLRENHCLEGAPRFFCCDSIASLAAYRRLGIALVPVAIISREAPLNLTHSAFELCVARNLGDTQPRVAGFRPCTVESLLATNLDGLAAPEALASLEQRVEDVLGKLTSFHAEGHETLHYHDTLHSTLTRTRDYLAGARCLLNASLYSQAVSLYRSLYELHLNFYADWVAPENSWMESAHAVNADSQCIKILEKKLQLDFSQGRPRQKAEQLAKRALLLARWMGVVKNKASFAPVGIGFHDAYYGYLSSVQHQDFRETASHANRFRSENHQVIDNNCQDWLSLLVNVVVTETLELIESDIGEPTA